MRRVLLVLTVIAAVAVTASTTGAATIASTTFTSALSGPGGTGTAVVKVNPGGKICYLIDVTLTTPGDMPQEPAPGLGNAHIHYLSTGGIAVDLETTFEALGDGMFVASGCVRADRDLVRDILLNPDQYYVNIHTVAFPGGAVSGSLG
jgi:hypothetical protein